jgi:outer membrane protein
MAGLRRLERMAKDGRMRGMRWFQVAVISLGLSGAAQAESLTDALIAAYRNSNLLDQNQALLRAADEDVATAVARLRPVISFGVEGRYRLAGESSFDGSGFTVSMQDSFSATMALTAELTLYDSGRGWLAIEVAKETVLATRQSLIDVEQRVMIEAVQAYINVKFATEIVFLRQSNMRVITQELRAAQDRFEVGENTRTDVALAEARLAAARAELASAEGDLMIAREAYKIAVGHYPKSISTLPRPPATAASLDEARAVAVRTHPIVRQSQHEVKIAEFNVKRAVADTGPSVSANVQFTDPQGSFNNTAGPSTEVGLSYSQIIYAGGQLASLHRRALAQQEAAKSALLQNTLIVEENVGNAWANLLVAQAQIEATDRQIAAAQIAFNGLREEAKLGARTSLDVLDAEQELLDAKVARARADATRYLGIYSLLQAMGLLTVEHLGLGIPTYDPAAYYRAVKDAPVHTPQGRKLDRILKAIGRD